MTGTVHHLVERIATLEANDRHSAEAIKGLQNSVDDLNNTIRESRGAFRGGLWTMGVIGTLGVSFLAILAWAAINTNIQINRSEQTNENRLPSVYNHGKIS